MTAGARIGYLDCSTGVSGDKFLGALLDVGASDGTFTGRHVQELLDVLAPEARLVERRTSTGGISAIGVNVEATEKPRARDWSSIRTLLATSALPEPVRDTATEVFSALAVAEARAHGCAVEEVHFHEVGALDSILDVVGVCAGVHALGISQLFASEIATGWGTVDTSHGTLPVPAPATAALLLGVPVVTGPARRDGSSPGELTTPTGAALLTVLAGGGFGPCPPMTPSAIGYGAGTRQIDSPNVCRVTIGVASTSAIELHDQNVTVLETNIDHLSPEAVAVAAEQLLAEGALDVWTSPVVMKKGRSAFVLSVLALTHADSARPGAPQLAERIVALTGTLGIRRLEVERLAAAREVVTVDTEYGAVRIKVGPAGAMARIRPESADVASIARRTGRAYRDIESELIAIAESRLGDADAISR